MKRLLKKDALFVIYGDDPDCEVLNLYLTKKDEGGNYYGGWFDFQPELDELGIIESEDEWITEKITDRHLLKSELEKRGFSAVFGENY